MLCENLGGGYSVERLATLWDVWGRAEGVYGALDAWEDTQGEYVKQEAVLHYFGETY